MIWLALAGSLSAQRFVPNYDEAKVPKFEVPDPLAVGGTKITSKEQWEKVGRPATLKLIAEQMYGKQPTKVPKLNLKLDLEVPDALDGKAIRREYVLTVGEKVKIRMLVYLPKTAGPVPAFMGLNFRGNQCLEKDPTITAQTGFVLGGKKDGDNKAYAESLRGSAVARWSAKMVVERGYALITACCTDIDPDFHDGFKNGVHALFPEPKADEWGTVSGWAWGLSRMLDSLAEVKEIDEGLVALLGHSRLGKTSLWAGATDPRFALVISNNSGCGGAALNKRAFGETVGRINRSFPHWFNGNFKKYNENEGALTFDQHQLVALIAPRPVYVASATKDRWADPKGEFLSLLYAESVYKLHHPEIKPLGVSQQPEPGKSVGYLMGYHLRDGKHDVTAEDWKHYLAFGDRWLKIR